MASSTFRYYPEYIRHYTIDNKTCFEARVENRTAVTADGQVFALGESNRALPGDTVIISVTEDDWVGVIDIKRRARNLIAGILVISGGKKKYGKTGRGLSIYEFRPLSTKYPSFMVPSSLVSGLADHYAVIEFNDWPSTAAMPSGTLVRCLGPVSSPEAEDLALRYKNEVYRKAYDPKLVGRVLESCRPRISRLNRQEATDRPIYVNTISIDPAGSTDLDDAFSVDSEGNIHVHIADVDYYLPESGNELEELMASRVTSVYGPKVDHLLPEIFSSEIITLKPSLYRELCPVITVVLGGGLGGELGGGLGGRLEGMRVILAYLDPSAGRQLTYEEAQRLLENDDKDLCHVAKATGQTDTHLIVQELMITANHYVGKLLAGQGTILRTMPQGKVDVSTLPEILKRRYRYKTPAEYTWSTDATEHAALGLCNYTHFTSPIRRYVDLLVHRQLKRDKRTDEARVDLAYINEYMRKTRCYYRDRDIVNLQRALKGEYYTTGYIVNYSNGKVRVFLPEFDMEYVYPLMTPSASKIFSVTDEEKEIIVTSKDTGLSDVLKKYTKIEVRLTPMQNVANLHGRVIMTIGLGAYL